MHSHNETIIGLNRSKIALGILGVLAFVAAGTNLAVIAPIYWPSPVRVGPGPRLRVISFNLLRDNFTTPMRIEQLAAAARMSPSSFHQHFKEMTAMTPLQYQKNLRLLEARRLMVADGASVATAAYEVGYESASQFSREYTRMFGMPPARDAVRLRETGLGEAVAAAA